MAESLRKARIAAEPYHAGLTDKQRIDIQNKWLNEKQCKVPLFALYSFWFPFLHPPERQQHIDFGKKIKIVQICFISSNLGK